MALHVLEDLGFYCIDNIPAGLLRSVVEEVLLRRDTVFDSLGVGLDARNRPSDISQIPALLRELRADGLACEIVYLQARDDILLSRFSETRRPHPLSKDGPVEDGIRREQEILRPIRDQADRIIDTSRFNVHELRAYIFESFSESSRRESLFVSVISFGYKHGIPPESDMILDVRFLPNPNFEEELRSKSGLDPEVEEWLAGKEDYVEYYSRVSSLLEFLMPRFVKEGKSYVTVAVGCTGGRHRSVLLARKLGEELRGSGYHVRTAHRDLERG